MRLLEQNSTEQTVFDGAQLHQHIFKSNGKLFGLNLSFTSTSILISAGLLLIKGYRISFTNETIYNLGTYPASTEYRSLILRITSAWDGNCTAEVIVGSVDNTEDIELGPGVYDYLLAIVTVTSEGIVGVESKIIDIGSKKIQDSIDELNAKVDLILASMQSKEG